MPWRVRRSDVDFFRDDLWKDLRPFPSSGSDNLFAKDCFERESAVSEAAIMLYLRERLGCDALPRPVAVAGQVLVLERVRGARLFDLIRHLKTIENERRDGVAQVALEILIDRSRGRLGEIQGALYDVRDIFAERSYPLERKLRGLLELFIRVLDIRQPPAGWTNSLSEFVDYWDSECVYIPFRDATTKNMIVSEPRLAISAEAEDGETAQRLATAALLDVEGKQFWRDVRIADIDFSSVSHLTSFEDDPISLLCHEWTFGSCTVNPSEFLTRPTFGSPSGQRAAATFLVRYLRFGGRKLAYRLINCQGFKVRFAYDDPLFYFERLPAICTEISPSFVDSYRPLFGLIESIAEKAANPGPQDAALMSVDHLRRFYPAVQYWQQNPLSP